MTTRSILFKGASIAAVFALAALGGQVSAQPTFGNPSPTAGSRTSEQANAAADTAAYRPVDYANKGKKGPALVVIPGEIKSTHTRFHEWAKPNGIADLAEVELSQANFVVLERKNLGPVLQEIQLAYNLGDVNAARKTMQSGPLKTAKWLVRFDIVKAEQIAENKQGFNAAPLANIAGRLGFGGPAGGAAGSAARSVKTEDSTGVWLVGMHYKIIDANTTEQIAQNYHELKMEVGTTKSTVVGVSQSAKGGVGLDTMIQRLVQTAVYEIDLMYK